MKTTESGRNHIDLTKWPIDENPQWHALTELEQATIMAQQSMHQLNVTMRKFQKEPNRPRNYKRRHVR